MNKASSITASQSIHHGALSQTPCDSRSESLSRKEKVYCFGLPVGRSRDFVSKRYSKKQGLRIGRPRSDILYIFRHMFMLWYLDEMTYDLMIEESRYRCQSSDWTQQGQYQDRCRVLAGNDVRKSVGRGEA